MDKRLQLGLFIGGSLLFLGLLIAKRDAIAQILLSPAQEAFVQKLNPAVRDKFRSFIQEIQSKLGWTVIPTSSYRDYAHQMRLKAENSSNASPGYSPARIWYSHRFHCTEGFANSTQSVFKGRLDS